MRGRRSERDDAERAVRLQRVTSALAGAVTPEQVASATLAEAHSLLRARASIVRVPEDGDRRLRTLAIQGQRTESAVATMAMEGSPAGRAFRTGQPLYLPSGAALADAFPDCTGLAAELGDGSAIHLPLIGSTQTVGVMVFTFRYSRPVLGGDRRFLETLSGLCAQALQRAGLYEQEQRARHDAEAARERLALLADMTRLLGSSLDPRAVISELAELVAQRMADGCLVLVPGDHGLESRVVRGRGSLTDKVIAALARHGTVRYDEQVPSAVAYRTGRPQLVDLTPDMLRRVGVDAPGGPPRGSTALAAPLPARGEVIGVMTFVAGIETPPFGPDDIALGVEVAARAGVALDNATRFQREHHLAETLQRAVLPERLVGTDRVEADAEYRPAAPGTLAGGDWYDAFVLGDGRLCFSVGDVMGKGASAAALMGQVRSAIRAFAVTDPSPASVLRRLDRLFAVLREDRLVTLVVGVIDPANGEVRMANAGHPPPLVVADGAAVPLEDGRSRLVGALPTERVEHLLRLAPGGSLLLYSDGLVERRGEPITDGIRRLARAATEVHGGAAGLADHMGRDYDTDDDVVVLVLRYTGWAPAPRAEPGPRPAGARRAVTLPPEVGSAPAARRWLAAELVGLPQDVVDTATLLVSELVANAVLHAGTSIALSAHLLADRVRVDVADGSPAVPFARDHGIDAATGRGITLFDALTSSWGVEPDGGGKVVWFELPVDVPMPESGTPGPPSRLRAGPPLQPTERVEVRLRAVPVRLLRLASEQHEALFRELRLVAESERKEPADHVLEIASRFRELMSHGWRTAVEGDDVVLSVDPEIGSVVERCGQLLDEADRFCRDKSLITLPASPTDVAVSKWVLHEVTRQVRGEPPVAWPDSRWARAAGSRPAAGR